jgi:hypothetical protein
MQCHTDYEQRYAWIERVCLIAFLAGIGVALALYGAVLPSNDPRGLAVGFALDPCGSEQF